MKNKYFSTGLGLYFNYVVHGVGTIILAQNIDFLADKWGIEKSAVLWVISALGLGRMFSMAFSGALSDRFGRKLFVILGVITYILFFMGILYSPTPQLGFFFAFLGGIANAFLDTGTYPALIEAFPKRAGFASIVVGFAVSWGQFLYPLLLAFLLYSGIWLGYSFIIPSVLIAISGIYIFTRKFPQMKNYENKDELNSNIAAPEAKNEKARWYDAVVFVLYSFFCQATSYIVVNWLASYAAEISGVTVASSRVIMSLYGFGALLCVPITYKLEDYLKNDANISLLYTAISAIAVVLLLLFPSSIMSAIFALLIGIATEGGVMQLVLTIMTRFFPKSKGKSTGIYYTMSGLATFCIPIITGWLLGYGLRVIMILDLIVALIALILAIIIYKRYKVVIGEEQRENEKNLVLE
jgi:MFS family permease